MRYYIKYENDVAVSYAERDVLDETMTEVSKLEYYKTRFKNGFDDTDIFNRMQDDELKKLIHQKYSLDDENKIVRQKITGLDTGEFEKYNAYILTSKTISEKEIQAFIDEVKS